MILFANAVLRLQPELILVQSDLKLNMLVLLGAPTPNITLTTLKWCSAGQPVWPSMITLDQSSEQRFTL